MSSDLQLPLDPPHPFRAQRNLRELQASGPVHRVRTAVGDPAWLVTGYREIRELLGDPRLGRTHPDPANAPRSGESALLDGPSDGPLGGHENEGEQVARLRTLLQPHFSPRRMQELRPRIEALTGDLLDGLAKQGPPADVAEAVALPLPRLVICELLGVPERERDRLTGWTEEAGDTRDRERSTRGRAALFGYGRELVERKRAHPAEDVISRLASDATLPAEKVAQIAMGVLFAGYETTVAAICAGLPLLLDSPEQWRAVQSYPELIPSAAEESLRVVSRLLPPDIRYARERLEIAGAVVRPGELVLLSLYAADHDASVFSDPERFDIHRKNNGAHLSFGYGPRYCVGAPLARMELQAVLGQLARRFPGLRLATRGEEMTVRQGSFAALPAAIPAAW